MNCLVLDAGFTRAIGKGAPGDVGGGEVASRGPDVFVDQGLQASAIGSGF